MDTFALQWFPGHMAKAKRELAERVKQVDFVIEVADARAPRSTRNPELEPLINERPRLLVLAKADLAEAGATRAWRSHFAAESLDVIDASLLDGSQVRRIRDALRRITRGLDRGRGATPPSIRGVAMPRFGRPPARGMVVGMPNTGKSSLIRSLGGGKVATGNRPGVTRGVQELTLGERLTLLDTPGLLWPRGVRGKVALHIAWLGYVGERSYDVMEAGLALVMWLHETGQSTRLGCYDIDSTQSANPRDALTEIARRTGRFADGDQAIVEGATILLRDFRAGRLCGPLSLERPGDECSDGSASD